MLPALNGVFLKYTYAHRRRQTRALLGARATNPRNCFLTRSPFFPCTILTIFLAPATQAVRTVHTHLCTAGTNPAYAVVPLLEQMVTGGKAAQVKIAELLLWLLTSARTEVATAYVVLPWCGDSDG